MSGMILGRRINCARPANAPYLRPVIAQPAWYENRTLLHRRGRLTAHELQVTDVTRCAAHRRRRTTVSIGAAPPGHARAIASACLLRQAFSSGLRGGGFLAVAAFDAGFLFFGGAALVLATCAAGAAAAGRV